MPSTLEWLAAAYILLAIFSQVLQIGATYFSAQLAWSATNTLRSWLAKQLGASAAAFALARSGGEAISGSLASRPGDATVPTSQASYCQG